MRRNAIRRKTVDGPHGKARVNLCKKTVNILLAGMDWYCIIIKRETLIFYLSESISLYWRIHAG